MRSTLTIAGLALLAALGQPLAGSGTQPASSPRVYANNVIPLLDQDRPIFGMFVNYIGIGADRESAIAHARNPNLDFVIYDLEHTPFDLKGLSDYMQWLLDRATIARAGSTQATLSVFVRVPVNARERNEWVIKNILDTGVHGLAFPHTETVEQVLFAIRSMRYPQKPGAADFEPEGLRGSSPAIAARYWGLSNAAYVEQSDIWRLSPEGNLLPIFIIENKLGIANVRDIARTLKDMNIGAVLWAGSGDLSMSYAGDQEAVARALDEVLAAGREFGLPVALNGTQDVARRVEQGARMFVSIGNTPPAAARKEAGR
jgi:4-hydroxy-2-oxoheptanedioate aldolase